MERQGGEAKDSVEAALGLMGTGDLGSDEHPDDGNVDDAPAANALRSWRRS